jgi:hypothetical protein
MEAVLVDTLELVTHSMEEVVQLLDPLISLQSATKAMLLDK